MWQCYWQTSLSICQTILAQGSAGPSRKCTQLLNHTWDALRSWAGPRKIERVYFEISESSRTQWRSPRQKESKRQFIFDAAAEGGSREDARAAVNFCEDIIFRDAVSTENWIWLGRQARREEEEEEGDSSYVLEVEGEEEEEEKSLECASAFAMACTA